MKVRTPYLYLVPAIVVLSVVTVFPIGSGVYFSLMEWDWSAGQQSHPTFIGLQNYIRVFHDPYFWNSGIPSGLLFTSLSQQL